MMYHSNNGSTTIVYTNEIPSGIKTNANELTVSLFPNPATEKIVIMVTEPEQQNLVLHISNCLGEKIAETTLKEVFTELSVSNFPKGIYYYLLKGNNESYTGKFIVD